MVRDVRPAFAPQEELVALSLQEGSPSARLSPGRQRGQVLVGDPQGARPRQHLDLDAVPQVVCVYGFALSVGVPGRGPTGRTAHVPNLSIDGGEGRLRQAQVGLDGERQSLLRGQALDAVPAHVERLERRAAVRRVERVPERPARSDHRQQPERVEEVALAGGVRPEQHDQRLELHFDVGQRLVALDVNSLQHAVIIGSAGCGIGAVTRVAPRYGTSSPDTGGWGSEGPVSATAGGVGRPRLTVRAR